jgi:hypothetical protein
MCSGKTFHLLIDAEIAGHALDITYHFLFMQHSFQIENEGKEAGPYCYSFFSNPDKRIERSEVGDYLP